VSPAIGVYVNNRAAVFGGDRFGLDDLLALAQRAEECGFGFVSVGDSVLAKPRWSPIVTLAAVAEATETIGLATGILQPHLRHPVTVAQEWATLDALSGGRTAMGVGLGTGPPELVDAELALVGLDRRRRARAFTEAIEVIKTLWAGDGVDYDGGVYQLNDVSIGLRPAQRPGPPVLIAAGVFVAPQRGFGPNDVFDEARASTFIGRWDRVARLGDGWITGMATPHELRAGGEAIAAAAGAAGRTLPEPFDVRVNLFLLVGDSPDAARAEGAAFMADYHRRPMDDDSIDRWLVWGPAEACAERLAAFAEAGATSFQCVLASVDQQPQMERVATELLPLLAG
jgi:alkanesulfonate monooxygenase SsuD/methylene tetrahydromethanopterin reductase-like flavin-dependent oxidoreductase (luciferase family)